MSKVAEAIQNQSIKNDGAGQLEFARYAEALQDAELLLKYAAEVGQVASSQAQGAGGQTAASPAKSETAALPPGISRTDVVTELQTFASTIRSIDSRARQLNLFIFNCAKDPFGEIRGNSTELKKKLQLPVPLPDDLATVSNDRIQVYQDVRYLGQSAVDAVAVFYGAITTGILPVLYALLGTCAYLLRSYEQEMRNRTFLPSHADFPRFMIAAIAGAVVGLFNNFTISQGASIPPLAIAFLVGYAVDVFFSFLEGMIQAFTKNKSAPPQAPRVLSQRQRQMLLQPVA